MSSAKSSTSGVVNHIFSFYETKNGFQGYLEIARHYTGETINAI